VDLLVEGLPRHQLHRHVVDRLGRGVGLRALGGRAGGEDAVVADLVDGDDVRVVEGRGRFRLGDEAPHPLVVAHQVRREDLQRHAALEGLVARDVHLAHPAGAERSDDAVACDPVFRLERAGHEVSSVAAPAARRIFSGAGAF
jgi:hypothetical protein